MLENLFISAATADSFPALVTGDLHSAPFTTSGSYFSSRGHTGPLAHAVTPVPEPATLLLTALGLAGLALGLRVRV